MFFVATQTGVIVDHHYWIAVNMKVRKQSFRRIRRYLDAVFHDLDSCQPSAIIHVCHDICTNRIDQHMTV